MPIENTHLLHDIGHRRALIEELDRCGGCLGRYRADAVLANGGTSIVLRAIELAKQRVVAIKLISPFAGDPRLDGSASFHRDIESQAGEEARLGRALNHRGIVRYLGIGRWHGHRYLILQYVDGLPVVHFILKREPMPLPMLMAVLERTCEALSYLHRQHYLHRDVVPNNLMLAKDGSAVLLDLGSAERLEAPDGPQAFARDIFGLGLIVYNLLTGQVPEGIATYPFVGTQPTGVPVRPRELMSDCPRRLDRLVMQMLPHQENSSAPPIDGILATVRGLRQRLGNAARPGHRDGATPRS